jgi:hypothetical protein
VVRYPSFDKLEIPACLYKPHSASAANKVPTVVWVPAVLSAALDAARSIGDGGTRSRALASLAPHLPERERAAVLSAALDAARSLGDEGHRSEALASLVPHLPAELLPQALDAARSLGDEGRRSRALASLVPHLPAELLPQALDAARSIGYEWSPIAA